jgi:thiamine-monophosphate kinase
MTEFELIRRYFASSPVRRPDVYVGVGDDAALVRPPPGAELAITTDALVAGVHFDPGVDPAALGHKALAANLSDLAAMGAEPAWFLLALTLPAGTAPAWIERLAQGMQDLARAHDVQLIGGDLTRGPLALAITALATVPAGRALRRSGARAGDRIYVTGTLGDAALALALPGDALHLEPEERAQLRARLERPAPRVAEGRALRGLASAAIDVSDGLLADLGHVLAASGVGARLELGALPLSDAYRRRLRTLGWDYALAGGDDYELCFTLPPEAVGRLEALARPELAPFTAIGEVTAARDIEIRDPEGRPYRPSRRGFDHFADQG